MLSGSRRVWTDDEIVTLQQMRCANADLDQIANALGRSRGSVKNQLLILKRRQRLFSSDMEI